MSVGRKRLVVTGREGQVVRSLLEKSLRHADLEILALGRPELDLGTPASIDAAIESAMPDLIVSAAAYTAVDQAETEEELATTINAAAAGELARTAARLGAPIIHISTDYVFDGSKPAPYVETDAVAPLGAYGRSKLAGERAVTAATANHAILRTAWVYSPFGKNFLKTMLRVAEGRDSVNVVDDQTGNPTSALDIADAVIAVARNLLGSEDRQLRGTFHLTGTGSCSWADFATEIFRASAENGGPFATVNRIASSEYPTPVTRPANSRLDCSKLHLVHGVVMPDWKASTDIVVRRLVIIPV